MLSAIFPTAKAVEGVLSFILSPCPSLHLTVCFQMYHQGNYVRSKVRGCYCRCYMALFDICLLHGSTRISGAAYRGILVCGTWNPTFYPPAYVTKTLFLTRDLFWLHRKVWAHFWHVSGCNHGILSLLVSHAASAAMRKQVAQQTQWRILWLKFPRWLLCRERSSDCSEPLPSVSAQICFPDWGSIRSTLRTTVLLRGLAALSDTYWPTGSDDLQNAQAKRLCRFPGLLFLLKGKNMWEAPWMQPDTAGGLGPHSHAASRGWTWHLSGTQGGVGRPPARWLLAKFAFSLLSPAGASSLWRVITFQWEST